MVTGCQTLVTVNLRFVFILSKRDVRLKTLNLSEMKVFDKHIYVCMYAFVFIYIYNVKKRFGYYGKTHKEYKRKSG